MERIKKPLNRSVLNICVIAFSILCVVLTLLNYFSYRYLLFDEYNNHMKNILTNTACVIDTDDLAECIRTGKESQKYQELQTELDMRKDNTDLHYLYIIIPLNTEKEDNIQNVIAAMSSQEYEESPEDKVELNSLTGDSYTPDVAAKYLKAYEKDEMSYFENVTEFGYDYTCVLPLYDSRGNKIAALCVDIEMYEIRSELIIHSLRTIGVTLLAGVLITVLFLRWTKKNVVNPIETLEEIVSDYTDHKLNVDDPDSLLMEAPDIHTGNEVESLSNRIVKMSDALHTNVKNMLQTERKLAYMKDIAHKDDLTKVGNKTAYKNYLSQLQMNIDINRDEFAVVVADINRLKMVNDTYGHAKGDAYISTSCKLLCDIYDHSPVFRVGGDEFIIFLQGHDYENRDQLLNKAKERIADMLSDEALQPWEAVSIALGMAVYDPESEESVQQVVTRADQEMYADKKRSKETGR